MITTRNSKSIKLKTLKFYMLFTLLSDNLYVKVIPQK